MTYVMLLKLKQLYRFMLQSFYKYKLLIFTIFVKSLAFCDIPFMYPKKGQLNYFRLRAESFITVRRMLMNENLDATGENFSQAELDIERALRPITFDDFTGQEQVLENLKVFVEAANQRDEALDHTLLPSYQSSGARCAFY